MVIKVTGKADQNRTVEELMKEVARTGNKYLDLTTGNFIDIVPDTASTPKKETKKYTKEELEKLSMKELRKIGKPLGAADTKKSELIDEILEKQ
ncbi:MAG: DUF7440 family protein [Candidatus Heimdallarchaeaceae archaeon]